MPACDDQELDHFLGRYHPGHPGQSGSAPDLAHSLEKLARHPGAAPLFRPLPEACACLIEGYAGAGNAAALRSFLGHPIRRRVEIVAVDLYDLPAAFRRLGLPRPDLQFVQADACALQGILPDAAFHLVVQDFLLNCVPPALAPSLLAETARVLHPEGLFLLSYTDDTCLADRPVVRLEDLRRRSGEPLPADARGLFEWSSDPLERAGWRDSLGGSVVRLPGMEGAAFVTRPHGRFEFFVPRSRTLAQLRTAGFALLLESSHRGRDDHGLECTRHHCLLRRS